MASVCLPAFSSPLLQRMLKILVFISFVPSGSSQFHPQATAEACSQDGGASGNPCERKGRTQPSSEGKLVTRGVRRWRSRERGREVELGKEGGRGEVF